MRLLPLRVFALPSRDTPAGVRLHLCGAHGYPILGPLRVKENNAKDKFTHELSASLVGASRFALSSELSRRNQCECLQFEPNVEVQLTAVGVGCTFDVALHVIYSACN